MDMLDDLSVITTIPKKNLSNFKNYLFKMHSNKIVSGLKDSAVVELDIFEGTLLLTQEDDSIKFKFIPNQEFLDMVKSSVVDGRDDLVLSSIDKLKNAFINTYKDLF